MRALRCHNLQGGAAGGAVRAPAVSALALPSGGAHAALGMLKSAWRPNRLLHILIATSNLHQLRLTYLSCICERGKRVPTGTEIPDNSSAHTQGPSPQPLPCQEQVSRALPQPVKVPGALSIPQSCMRLGRSRLARLSVTCTRRATPPWLVGHPYSGWKQLGTRLEPCGTSAHGQWLPVGLLCSSGAVRTTSSGEPISECIVECRGMVHAVRSVST